MIRSFGRKLLSIFASLSIVLQSVFPGALLLARPAFAQDATPSAADTPPASTTTTDSSTTQTATPPADAGTTVTSADSSTPSATGPEATPPANDTNSVPGAESTATPEATPPVESTPATQPDTQTSDTPPAATDANSNNPPSNTDSTSAPETQPQVAGSNTPAEPEHGSISATIVKNASTPTLNLDSQTSLSSAAVSTDKADYSPTDTVIITGVNFVPNKDYTLEISSPDPPAVDFQTAIKSNDTGSFVYAYQLDGNYRPNYKVEVKDASGTVVASTTFTDSRTVNSATLNGAATATVVASSSVNASVNVTHDTSGDGENDWKSTGWRIGTSGSFTCVNTPDHNSTGTDSESFNITAPSSPGTYTVQFQAYSDNGCSQGASSVFGLTDALTVIAAPSWPTGWTTPAQCSVDPSDESPSEVDLLGDVSNPAVGFGSDANYMYFRERLEGNPGAVSNLHEYSWVVLFQTSTPQYQYLGTISGKAGNKVQLWNNPTNSPSSGGVDFSPLFNDPADSVVWEGASTNYGRVTSSGGVYFIDWAIPLSELTSRGIDINTTKFFATSTNANNYNKDHLNCYEAIADLSIVKSDNPDPVTSGGTLTYTLTINNAGPDTASSVIVTDTLPAGYSVTSVTPSQGSCSDTSAPSIQCELGSMSNGANATVTIVGTMTGSGTVTNTASVSSSTLDTNTSNNSDSEDTTINPATGTLVVHKTFTDQHSNSGITITVNPGSLTQSTNGSGDATFSGLTPGTYTAHATEPSGYYESGNDCVNVSVAAGQTANCTITDSRILGTITVTKTLVGGQTVLTQFGFTLSPDPGNGQVFADSNGIATFSGIPVGTYSVSETTSVSGYSETANNCSGLTISTNGQQLSCGVTNTRDTGTVIVHKDVVNPDGGAVTDTSNQFGVSLDGADEQLLTDGGAVTYTNVPTGAHTISESTIASGYTLDSISPDSDGGTTGAQISVAKNQTTDVYVVNKQQKATITVVKDVRDTNGNDISDNHSFTAQLNGGTNQSFSEGNSTSYGVNPGSYTISELDDPNYTEMGCKLVTGADATEFNVSSGSQITVTCTNKQNAGTISGTKYDDNQNVLSGWVIDLYGCVADFSVCPNYQSSQTTDVNGNYTFDGLLTGYYRVLENMQPGWTNVSSTSHDVTIEPGANSTGNDFVNKGNLSLTACKYEDSNGTAEGGTMTAFNGWGPFRLFQGETFLGSQTAPQDNNCVTFTDLKPGSYRVTENPIVLDSWYVADGSGGNQDVTLTSENATVNFYNYRKGTVTVHKNVDENGDGQVDSSDVTNWQWNLDEGDNIDTGSSADNVEPGTHLISEVQKVGYRVTGLVCNDQTYDPSESIRLSIESGGSIDCTFTNTRDVGTISGKKFNDINGDTEYDFETESVLSGWTIKLYEDNDGSQGALVASQVTTGDGYQFTNVPTGSYFVCEELQSGWAQTTPVSNGGCHLVTISQDGQEVTGQDFGNRQTKLIIYKYDQREQVLGGATFQICPEEGDCFTVTDNGEGDASQQAGVIEVDGLAFDFYTVTETQAPAGYLLDQDFCERTINSEETQVSCSFVNQFQNPILTITKKNDASGDKSPGDSVLFTITVTATQSAVNNVTVSDLPAGGFVYHSGSWTANSTVRGDLKALAITPEPVYSSPGTWQLGNMISGETVTLTYIADIDGSQEPGLYKDLAWAQGTSLAATTVQANATDPGFVDEHFAGSQVNVVKSTGQSTTSVQGQVLGASTSLPATGSRTIWVILASLLVSFGIMHFGLGIGLRKGFFKGILAAIFLGLALFAPTPTLAAGTLSVRVEEPKSPTSQNTFKINFVAQSYDGQPITAKCYKKGPSDGGFSQFGGDISLPAGGNSANCSVDSGVVNTQGTYQFYVTAESSTGSNTSNTVSVTYNTSGPDTPTDYLKEGVGPCQFKISFKTANDAGKTAKVIIYRGDNTSFNLDSGTEVGTVNIGSNAFGSFTNTVPDCGKTYYYEIRAFDSAGNGSGVVGDNLNSTTTTTTTTGGSGAIPIAQTSGGTGSVLGAEQSATQEGGVLGEATPSGGETVTNPAPVPPTPTSPWPSAGKILAGLAGLAILIAAYVFYRRPRSV